MLRAFIAVLICICATPILHGQSSSASITGFVTDPGKAIIVGATITAINEATNARHQGTTSANGSYYLSNLPPGSYRVEVEKRGFRTVLKPNVVLHVQDAVQLNFDLAVGSTTESVTVSGGTPLINTETAVVSTVVDRQFVENMPLNGRSFQALIALAPGVVLTPSFNSVGQFSVNGQRANANQFSVDGVSANVDNGIRRIPGEATAGTLPGFTTLGGTNSLVSVDAMQEFRIQTSTYSAEFGRSPGGQISIVTRSGTNDFHGSLFEYFRNDVLDANDWFLNNRGLKKPAMRQNDFGGVFGGPVILPFYSGRDRTFFFVSYEGLRLRTPQFALTNVPSLALRQMAAPAMQPILNAFPLPNGRNLANGFAEFAAGYSDPSTVNATSFRLDHHLSNRLVLFGRYNHAPSESLVRNSGGVNLATVDSTRLRARTLTLGATALFSPNLSNEVRVNYSENQGNFTSDVEAFGGAVPIPHSVLAPPQFDTPGTNTNGGVIIGLPGASVPVTSNVSFNRFANFQRQANLVDNISITTGSHQLKFGTDYRRIMPVLLPREYLLVMVFTSQASLLNGTPLATSVGASQKTHPIYNNLSLFAQDNWKIARQITLNLGLRWELNPPPSEADGNTPIAITGLDNLASLQIEPSGTRLWKTTYNNLAPRVGIAYQLSSTPGWETVIRGGTGIFYDVGNSQGSAGFGAWPFAPTRSITNLTLPLIPAQVAPPAFTRTPPAAEFVAFDPELKLPYVLQWSVGVEQALGKDQALTVSYVAAAGRRMPSQERINLAAVNPAFTTMRLVKSNLTSDYHSLQAQFRRRLAQGLQAYAAYTWAHAIDEASLDFTTNLILRGNSDYDIRHNFTTAVTYDIPGLKSNPFAKHILGGWSVDLRSNAQSALPLNVISGTIIDPITRASIGRRANLIANQPLYLEDDTAPGGRVVNRAAFAVPAVGQQGNLGRNVVRGLNAWQIDSALRRQFNLSEKVNLQFRAEAFNLFNHPNFGTINSDLTNVNFGKATNMLGRQLGQLNALYQIGGPRSLQLALKLQF